MPVLLSFSWLLFFHNLLRRGIIIIMNQYICLMRGINVRNAKKAKKLAAPAQKE